MGNFLHKWVPTHSFMPLPVLSLVYPIVYFLNFHLQLPDNRAWLRQTSLSQQQKKCSPQTSSSALHTATPRLKSYLWEITKVQRQQAHDKNSSIYHRKKKKKRMETETLGLIRWLGMP